MSSISSGTTLTTALVQTADTSGVLQLQTNGGTTAVTIDTNQNVGVGVTPSAWSGYAAFQTAGPSLWGSSNLGIYTTNTYYNGGYKYASTNFAEMYQQSSGVHAWYNAPSGTAGNAITFTQAMTLDVSGKLLVGTTSQLINESTLSLLSSGNTMTVKTTGGAGTVPILCWNNAASGTINLINFFYGSSLTAGGTITTNGTVTTLNSPSDYRLKNITGALTTSGAFIDALKPLVGTYKSNGSAFVGFIADQLQEVSPSSVQGEKDTVDENGNPVYQSLAYASPEIITNLIAEIQSVRKRLAALENK